MSILTSVGFSLEMRVRRRLPDLQFEVACDDRLSMEAGVLAAIVEAVQIGAT
jgi:hypothetical protein